MPIEFQVLGEAGYDNALFVRVASGQAIHRFLFDCGEGCLDRLSVAESQAVDDLLFSHLHMDHVGGFDSFFRRTFNRESKPMTIWGPPQTAEIMQHRFRGFMWNLYGEQPGSWHVNDVHPQTIDRLRFEASEAFAVPHPVQTRSFDGMLFETSAFSVHALHMDHRTPSLAYIVREKPRHNVDPVKLAALGLAPGPWLQQVKARRPDEQPVLHVAGKRYELAELRAALLVETPGQSLAYLTDFLMDAPAQKRLVRALQGCTTLVCESQYRHADRALAQRNYHLTATQAAELARQANAQHLILFHLSDRYRRHEWLEILAEARAIFPNTDFPDHWRLMPS